MSSVSRAQRRFMAAAAHDKEFAKKAGVPQTVAKEFNKADAGKSDKGLPEKKSRVSKRGYK